MTRRGRDDVGGEQVEGRRAVRELLAARRRRVRVVHLATDDDEVEGLARQQGVSVRRVDGAQLADRARTATPQGVIAEADPLQSVDADALLEAPGAFLLVLEGVTDPQNLGAVMRTANAAGATGAVLPRHRAARLSPAAAKSAAGAIEHVPVALVSGAPAFLERARRAGVWTVGLDADGDTAIFDLAVADQPLALVLGSEGAGLSRLTRARCDVLASIPMHGAIQSLNVAAAAAIACYEIARRRLPSNRVPE